MHREVLSGRTDITRQKYLGTKAKKNILLEVILKNKINNAIE